MTKLFNFFKRIKNMIEIGGKYYKGNNVQIKNNQVWIDGVLVESENKGMVINISSDIEQLNIETSNNIRIGNINSKEIKIAGSLNCDNIDANNISIGGSCNCDDIKGEIKVKGSLNCDNIIGNITKL